MKKIDCTIIPPTFNEAKNVIHLVEAIEQAFEKTPWLYEILFIDDSIDDTPKILRSLSETNKRIRFIHRKAEERTGLATAFIKGFAEAHGEIICCMDADLQHPPKLIPQMLDILKTNDDVSMVVASRYASGGSEEGLGSGYRKLVSNNSRRLTHFLFPDTKKTGDPMTGFFAFKKNILTGISLKPKGFKILVEMLVRISSIKVIDIPMRMEKRFAGYTKASLSQGIAFLKHLWLLGKSVPEASTVHRVIKKTKNLFSFKKLLALFAIMVTVYFIGKIYQLSTTLFSDFLLTLAFLQFGQGLFGLYLMIYAWDDPDRIKNDSSPETYFDPKLSFTAIIPARHEAVVIGETIQAVGSIDYPVDLVETLVILRDDDDQTIAAANIAISKLPNRNIKLLLINGLPINKPHHLNDGLKVAHGDIVCIFDAEDEPHRDIYNIVNTVMIRDKVDVIQSGVQLMNFDSNWYSMFNVLEYFLWFRSSLHFFAKHQLIPLGGNTVFFKRKNLLEIDGWDKYCLTEDAEIGIRLSLAGAKTRVIYDPRHVTMEETPPSLKSFIKQRTRWIQGFIQILKKPHWRKNQTMKKRALTLYTLGWPALQALLLFSIPFSLVAASFLKVHPLVSLVSSVPFLILVLFIITQSVALYDFTRLYQKKWSPWYVVKLIVLFIPYQFVLGISAIRATIRELNGNKVWEKTEHINAHRSLPQTLFSEKAVTLSYQEK